MFRLDSMTYDWLAQVNLPPMVVDEVRQWPQEQNLDRQTMEELLAERLPDLGKQSRQNLLSAAAVSAYHAQPEFPVPKLLVCDDADQFKRVTEEVALCWIHDGRHYKKLTPQVAHNQATPPKWAKRNTPKIIQAKTVSRARGAFVVPRDFFRLHIVLSPRPCQTQRQVSCHSEAGIVYQKAVT